VGEASSNGVGDPTSSPGRGEERGKIVGRKIVEYPKKNTNVRPTVRTRIIFPRKPAEGGGPEWAGRKRTSREQKTRAVGEGGTSFPIRIPTLTKMRPRKKGKKRGDLPKAGL